MAEIKRLGFLIVVIVEIRMYMARKIFDRILIRRKLQNND